MSSMINRLAAIEEKISPKEKYFISLLPGEILGEKIKIFNQVNKANLSVIKVQNGKHFSNGRGGTYYVDEDFSVSKLLIERNKQRKNSGIKKYNDDAGENITIEDFSKLVKTAREGGVSTLSKLSKEDITKLSEIFKKIIGGNFNE